MTQKIKFIVLTILILFALAASTMILLRRALVNDMELTYRLITKTQFQCPDGMTESIERCGKAGYMRFCKKGEVSHGPWTAWESQYKNIEGEYKNGKQHGLWTVWNRDGSKYRIMEYREGTEIRNEIIPSH